ncbi:hypothetical protein [Pseudomonas fluorescens]|uniref:hypothetical protein n=1 Tax=Pseudomonas fluorescens TaxID=294 RepID=UPI00123EE3BF|nr:hypothetical protein [Pseudomonas fluorescens]
MMASSKEMTIHKVCFNAARRTGLCGQAMAINTPEIRRMKRLTEWINLIAAVIRLISVISRTGWF